MYKHRNINTHTHQFSIDALQNTSDLLYNINNTDLLSHDFQGSVVQYALATLSVESLKV